MSNHLKEVLENCLNYDTIVNYSTSDSDYLSQILIKYYQDYVFFNWSSVNNIKMLDTIVFTFIEDMDFNNYIHDKYKNINDFVPVFDILLEQYNNYQKEKLEIINYANWI